MKERNLIVDTIRGFAMLLVVLGHTLSGSNSSFNDSILFRVVWTLQMPLFIIISGYVTRYSRPINDFEDLLNHFKKRTLAYLLPWFVWTIVIRAFIFEEYKYLNLNNLLWHTDSGYWFLLSIWQITIIYGISDYLSNKISRKTGANTMLHFSFNFIGILVLIIIGAIVGLNFLGIKLTLYYLPFFIIGNLYGKFHVILYAQKSFSLLKKIFVIMSLGFWLFMITRYDFFNVDDNIVNITKRFVTSVLGCIAIAGLFENISFQKIKIFNWAGIYSLEIYLTHYLFLNLITMAPLPVFMSLSGTILLFINYFSCLFLTSTTIFVLQKNDLLNKILYWK